MTRAIQKHREGSARVVPIILRDCDWNSAPFAALQALPPAARPVANWKPQDKAWKAVAEGIRRIASSFSSAGATEREAQVAQPESAIQRALRLKAESAKRQKRDDIVRNQGYSAFVAEVGAVYQMIHRKADEIRSETGLTIESGHRPDHCIARLKSTRRNIWPLTLHLYQRWDGELGKSHLNVRLLFGGMVLPQESGIMYPYKPKQLKTARYSLILADNERWLWNQNEGVPNMTSEELADVLLAELLQLHEDAETGVLTMPEFDERLRKGAWCRVLNSQGLLSAKISLADPDEKLRKAPRPRGKVGVDLTPTFPFEVSPGNPKLGRLREQPRFRGEGGLGTELLSSAARQSPRNGNSKRSNGRQKLRPQVLSASAKFVAQSAQAVILVRSKHAAEQSWQATRSLKPSNNLGYERVARIRYTLPMTARLRTIRTTFRSASVKRSEVRSAAKAAIVNRESRTQVYRDRKSGKQASAGFRK